MTKFECNLPAGSASTAAEERARMEMNASSVGPKNALHNAAKFAEQPNLQVLVCDSIYAAQSAQPLLDGKGIATAWTGDMDHADWSSLQDRRVGLLVEQGLEDALVAAISPFASKISSISRPADAAVGWTLADAPEGFSPKKNARVVYTKPQPVAQGEKENDVTQASTVEDQAPVAAPTPAEELLPAVDTTKSDPTKPRSFAAFIAQRYSGPEAVLDAFLADATAAAAEVDAELVGFPKLDGQWHYLPSKETGKREQRRSYNGDFVERKNGVVLPRITFRTFKGGGDTRTWSPGDALWGQYEMWKAGAPPQHSEDKVAEYAARVEHLRASAEALRTKNEGPAESADRARKLEQMRSDFHNGDPAPADHRYIVRKEGNPDGLRVVGWPKEGWADFKGRSLLGWLMVPAYGGIGNTGEQLSIQFIGPESGEKLNWPGVPMKGCSFTIGKPESGKKTYVAEGIGHIWTINGVTGEPAVMTFGASGIEAAARDLIEVGSIPVIVPDRGKEAEAAGIAARQGCWYALLPDDLPIGADVNDLCRLRGAVAVREVLEAAIAPHGGDFNDLVQEHGAEAAQAAFAERAVPTAPYAPRLPADGLGAVGKPPSAAQVRAAISDEMRDDDEALEPAVVREADRPVIMIERNNVKAINDQAEKALVTACPFLYSRGGEIVRPMVAMAPDGRGGAVRTIKIRSLKRAALHEHLDAAACWMKYDGRSKSDVPVDAPMTVADALLGRGASSLRPLTGVIEAPTLRADGSILDVPGYDAETGLLFLPNCDYPPVPQNPGRAEALAAIQRIEALIDKYPYVAPVDRSVALAAILTCSVRRALNKAPMFAMNAPAPGSGKSALVDVAAIIVTGSTVPVFAQGENEAEFEKRLHGALLAGHSVVSFDNVTRPIEGNALCQAMTQQTMEVRPLGTSDTRTVPTSTTFFATGNGLVVRDDMTRRVLECQLDPGVERPELRVFDFNPLEVAKAQRATLLVDALTVLRAHHLAQHEVRSRRFDFNEWSAMVADALVWLGYADPAASMDRTRASDPAKDEFRAVAREWSKHFGSKLASVREAIEAATEQSGGSFGTRAEFTRPDFREALLQIAGAGGAINSRSLGKWLARHVRFLVDGLTVHKADGAQNVQRWGFGPAVVEGDTSPPL